MKQFIKRLLGDKLSVKLIDFMNRLVFLFVKRPKKVEGNVGIIKTDALGDAVLWLQAGNSLYDYYESQGKTLYLICNKSQEAFYRSFSPYKNIITIDFCVKNNKQRKKIVESIRSVYFEKIINMEYSRCVDRDDFIIKQSSAKEKIGFVGDNTNRKNQEDINIKCYDQLLEIKDEKTFEGIRNAKMARALGANIVAEIPTLLEYIHGNNYRPYVALGIGASNAKRIFDIKKFGRICDYIIKNSQLDIRVLGGASEVKYYEELRAICPNERIINMCGSTDLQGLIDVLGNAKYTISNDTGTAHVACATGSVGAVILGGGNGNRFFPHASETGNMSKMQAFSLHLACENCGWQCIYNDDRWRCVVDIDENLIIQDIKNRIMENQF